jgi:hypothetical protein
MISISVQEPAGGRNHLTPLIEVRTNQGLTVDVCKSVGDRECPQLVIDLCIDGRTLDKQAVVELLQLIGVEKS